MNRREFIKTGLAFCGCVYLGFDLVDNTHKVFGSESMKFYGAPGVSVSVDLGRDDKTSVVVMDSNFNIIHQETS